MPDETPAEARRDSSPQPTALVNEAYLKLVDQARIKWEGRAHFLAVAARAMREVLVEYARRHRSIKRGGRAEAWLRREMAGLSA